MLPVVPTKLKLNRKPDNPQETLNENFYYSGFFAAEMTCSVIKAANYNPVGHYYFAVDITVTNADKALLQEVNQVVMKGGGIISSVKGAYNLSVRGKNRVHVVLDFLQRYPIIIGDLAKNRVALLREAFSYLEEHRGAGEHQKKIEVMDGIRKKLRLIKEIGIVDTSYPLEKLDRDVIGHFLAGILDGEGSFGFKTSGTHQEPFFAVAMKDRKIIKLCRDFLQYGNVRKRKDGVHHYEINRKQILQKVCKIFLTQYPLKHARQQERLRIVQRLLNDYTQNHHKRGE
ncbi:hypothetical protein EBR66_00290 [bacterium]|nr:hypothetical protein [bacterium]